MPLKGGDLNGIGNLFVDWSSGTRIEDGIRVSLSLYHWCDSGRTEGLTLSLHGRTRDFGGESRVKVSFQLQE